MRLRSLTPSTLCPETPQQCPAHKWCCRLIPPPQSSTRGYTMRRIPSRRNCALRGSISCTTTAPPAAFRTPGASPSRQQPTLHTPRPRPVPPFRRCGARRLSLLVPFPAGRPSRLQPPSALTPRFLFLACPPLAAWASSSSPRRRPRCPSSGRSRPRPPRTASRTSAASAQQRWVSRQPPAAPPPPPRRPRRPRHQAPHAATVASPPCATPVSTVDRRTADSGARTGGKGCRCAPLALQRRRRLARAHGGAAGGCRGRAYESSPFPNAQNTKPTRNHSSLG